jgi:hypothetical protein
MGIKRGRVVIRCRGIIKGREWTDDKWRGLGGGDRFHEGPSGTGGGLDD